MEDIPCQCHIIKDLVMGVSVSWVLKGLQSLHLTFWLLRDVCCTDKGAVPQSGRLWYAQLKCVQQKFTSSAGKNGLVGVLEKVY